MMASFGEELRRQRELRGVSLREISDATKINIRFLEALERNEFKHLPGGQFNKGFIRAFARHIGVNPEDMVDSYLQELRRQDETDRATARSAAPRRARGGSGARIAAIAIAAIIVIGALAAAGWWYLRAGGEAGAGAPGPVTTETPSGDAAPPSSGAALPPGDAVPPGEQHPSGDGSAAASPAPPPSGTADGAAEATQTGAQGTPAPAPGEPAPGAAPATPDGAVSPPVVPPAPAADVPSAPQPNLVVRIIPLQPSRLGLLCNGREVYAGPVEAGQVLKFDCAGVYEVSMDDAGAMNVSANGERIYLGRPGQSITGRHVSAANYLDYVNPPPGSSPP